MKPLPVKKGTVYRAFAEDGRLLYVGVTTTVSRFDQLKHTEWFRDAVRIELQHFDTWDEAADVECLAINTEYPIFNRMRHRQSGHVIRPRRRKVDVVSERMPDWIAYVSERRAVVAGWEGIAQAIVRKTGLESLSGETVQRWYRNAVLEDEAVS